MSISRKYSLPNCTLILEGMSDQGGMGDNTDRPMLSILVNAECHFTGHPTVISGSKEFLDSLVRSVSGYAQEFLSGIIHPEAMNEERVRFERLASNHQHRLIWQPEADQNGGNSQAIALDLTTVQLFDLLEAVDQCLADQRTLPNLTLELAPVSRRYRKAEVPAAQRVAPAALGISGLVLASAALFFIPIPDVREDSLPTEAETEEIIPENTEGTEPDPLEPEPSDLDPETPTTPQSLTPEVDPSLSPVSSPVSTTELENILASATAISNPTQLWYLQRTVYRTINKAWDNRDGLDETLTYRVSVTPGGLIVGYEPVEETPAGVAEATPLPEITYIPTQTGISDEIALADYRVVFTRRGVLQVSPWEGYKSEPTLGEEIRDPAEVARLEEELSAILASAWDGIDETEEDLVYRVGVTKAGAIADYQADNQAAMDYVEQTPFPQLWQPEAAGIGIGENKSVVPQKPLAQYEVVLEPDGGIKIQPWE
jgi:hypothetical protein